MKPSDVKNKEDFECLMRERADIDRYLRQCDSGYYFGFKCDSEGKPIREFDRMRVCEYQKLAMGSETAYVVCSEPRPALSNSESGSWEVGDLIRSIKIAMTTKERIEIMPFFNAITRHEPMKGRKKFEGGQYIGGNSFCAFPGGCE